MKKSPPKQGLQLIKKTNQAGPVRKEVTGKPPLKPAQPGTTSTNNSRIPRAAPSNTRLTEGGSSSNESGPEEGVRDSVGDISFQQVMQRREKHEEVS